MLFTVILRYLILLQWAILLLALKSWQQGRFVYKWWSTIDRHGDDDGQIPSEFALRAHRKHFQPQVYILGLFSNSPHPSFARLTWPPSLSSLTKSTTPYNSDTMADWYAAAAAGPRDQLMSLHGFESAAMLGYGPNPFPGLQHHDAYGHPHAHSHVQAAQQAAQAAAAYTLQRQQQQNFWWVFRPTEFFLYHPMFRINN